MFKNFGHVFGIAARGCGGAVLGAFLVGNLAALLGRHEWGPDSRAGLVYALYLGVPVGLYFGIRIAPAIDAKWQKFLDRKPKPPDL